MEIRVGKHTLVIRWVNKEDEDKRDRIRRAGEISDAVSFAVREALGKYTAPDNQVITTSVPVDPDPPKLTPPIRSGLVRSFKMGINREVLTTLYRGIRPKEELEQHLLSCGYSLRQYQQAISHAISVGRVEHFGNGKLKLTASGMDYTRQLLLSGKKYIRPSGKIN